MNSRTNLTRFRRMAIPAWSADLWPLFFGQLAKRVGSPIVGFPLALLLGVIACAQVNTGSDGRDGAFNPSADTVVDMADHPDGIYHYTEVNIPTNVTVRFIPNARNTPVVWLVQGSCAIRGKIDLSGEEGQNSQSGGVGGGQGGPGGYRGGVGGLQATGGLGPGGGGASARYGGSGSYGTLGIFTPPWQDTPPGPVYGNQFLIPLQGGSGGGGCSYDSGAGGGGGGGAILIAAGGTVALEGRVDAPGARGVSVWLKDASSGPGSGGAIRVVAQRITGAGVLEVAGGWDIQNGIGRVRIDCFENSFAGKVLGSFTQGFQPIIFPPAGQSPELRVSSIGGVAVSSGPTGKLATPDALLPAGQSSPISVVVLCSNLPLNTLITVSVKPLNGPPVSAVGYNSVGTLAESTATVSLSIPRGGGLVYATAATSN